MTLLTFDSVSLDFGEQIILRDASFALQEGERVCLIGRNGAGKSTLLKIVAGEQAYDRGEIKRKQDLQVSKLAQTLPTDHQLTVAEYVRTGLAGITALIDEYQHLAASQPTGTALQRLETLQRQIDAHGGW